MGNLQSELKTVDFTPKQLRDIYNDKKTIKTGGQYVYLIIKNLSLGKPFSTYPDDHQIHLQTFIVDKPGKIFQIAYNSDPNLFGAGFIKSMTRSETSDTTWSVWGMNQADGTTANYSGNVTVDGGDFSINNSNKKMDAKFCIGNTCLSQSTLNDILIASNSSLSLLSTVDTPYAKSIDGRSGACNWGYSGTISYSNDGKGLTGCVKCPSGYFKDEVGNTGCKPCAGGYFCASEGTTNRAGFAGMNTSLVQCDPGKYCPTGSYKQTVCPSGYYCPIGSFDGIACASGYYNPFTEKTQETNCTGCGPGYYCDKTGTFMRTDCPSGYYCPNTSNSSTVPCLAGKYNDRKLATGPSWCLNCPIGSYCPTDGMGSATPCTGGFVCATTGLTRGTICDAGKYCPQGTGTQTICPAGYFCVQQSATFANCTAGNYCPQGTGVQTVCPAGSYCPALTGTHTVCPRGTYRSTPSATGLVNCLTCAPGFHCQTGSISNATSCSVGNYCPTGYNTPCPVGYSCLTAGISGPLGSPSGPTICSSGYYCSGGIRTLCPVGSYCPSGVSAPTTCLQYTKTPLEGGTSQSDCNPVDIYGLYGTRNAEGFSADRGVTRKRSYAGTTHATYAPLDFSQALARSNGMEIGPSDNRRRIYMDWDIDGLTYLAPNENTANTSVEEFYERRCKNETNCSGVLKSGSTLYAVDNRDTYGYLPYNFRDSTNSAGYTSSRYKYHSAGNNGVIITKIPPP